jgi:hypothetical protein
VEFTVSKKREQAAYVDLLARPLFISTGVEFFGKFLAYVIPLGHSFRYHAPHDESVVLPGFVSPPPMPQQSTTPTRSMISRIGRADTARELSLDRMKASPPQHMISPVAANSPPSSPYVGRLATPKAVRPVANRREAFASERPQSVPLLPIASPAKFTPPQTPRSQKQKSFFRLRVDNTSMYLCCYVWARARALCGCGCVRCVVWCGVV